MPVRPVLLVLQYDGARYAGWQRQPTVPTVQGAIEDAVERLLGSRVPVVGAGRTDAGVHARGQGAHVELPARWTVPAFRRALNAVLPRDIWVSAAHAMCPGFHARHSALARRYSYQIGVDACAESPFRRPHEWHVRGLLDVARLDAAAAAVVGEHCFVAFAVRGTAPAADAHRCDVRAARWHRAPGRLRLEIEANRFLHHMVRFLVGTMVEVGAGRRPPDSVERLLRAADNREVAPPAPAHALFLDAVTYPADLYLHDA